MMPQMPRWVMEAIALYDYEPEEADELGFQEGECIRVTLVQDDGWWKGYVLDVPQRIGLFPSNYVQVKTRRSSQSDSVDSARSTTRNRIPQSTYAGEAEDEDDEDGDEADTNRYAPTTKTSSVAQLKQRLAEAERTSRAAQDARRKAEQQKLSKWQNWDDQDEDSGNEEEEEEDNGFYTQEQWRRHQYQQGDDDGANDDDDNEEEDEGAGHEQEDPDQYEEDNQEYYYGRPPLQSYEEEEEEDGGEDDDQGEENFERRGYDGTSIDYRTREDLEDDELSQQLDSDDLPLDSGRSSTYSEQELESAATRIAHGYRTHKHREAVKTARQQHASTVIVKTMKKNTQRVRSKKKRTGASANRPREAEVSGPSAAFLAALEAQRASQAQATEENTPLATSNEPKPARTHAHLPGFYYDDEKGKYFKLTKQQKQEQRGKTQREHEKAQRRQPEAIAVAAQRTSRRQPGWMQCMLKREVGALPRNRVENVLVSSLYASRVNRYKLVPLDAAIDRSQDRFTTSDFHASRPFGIVGFASGQICSFTWSRDKSEAKPVFSGTGITATTSYMVSAVRIHPLRQIYIYSAVGSSLQGTNRSSTGFVALHSDPALCDRPALYDFPDPWTAEWNPFDETVFSVGTHGKETSGAARIDVSCAGVSYAPTGKIKSDVLAQSWGPHAPLVLNGTRNGSSWLWDVRSSCRAQEVFSHGSHPRHRPSSTSTQSSPIQSLHILRDGYHYIQQHANGELAVMDMRLLGRPLVICSHGYRNQYMSMARCAVNDSETIVAAPSSEANNVVCFYDISLGRQAAQVQTESHLDHTMARLEQVHLRESGVEADSIVEVWSMSRNELYVSALSSAVRYEREV
ncbi:hypothetical protein Poli38472_009851 [Pythium oligandrum]|uniref:SH3 domain-containing protein n=1 Tax=Pythium oligandrum TaxID=41045 RepID=A0A8K1CG23_PYTOL|nr:hypothetical protein Poli38472_009851 [Pythium oligandrum]|eukprot:TMW62358.1 hypothetical protein Poli38472_009851 [Pythium oligandrum]